MSLVSFPNTGGQKRFHFHLDDHVYRDTLRDVALGEINLAVR